MYNVYAFDHRWNVTMSLIIEFRSMKCTMYIVHSEYRKDAFTVYRLYTVNISPYKHNIVMIYFLLLIFCCAVMSIFCLLIKVT